MKPEDLPALPCYLNGEFTTLPNARISVLDRGFIFGDGVYEVVPVYGGKLFRFDHHLARLDRSLRELRIPNPHTREQWLALVRQLIAQFQAVQPASEQLVYIQISRGVAMRDHVMPADIEPTVFIMTNLMKTPGAQQLREGVACVSADDFRWQKAHIKAVSLLGAVFARQISADVGAVETVMFRGEQLSEAASSNVWVVQGGKLAGPKPDHLVLQGIRYGLIEEMCRSCGIPFELRGITRAEVLAADELLLSSATKEVLAITTLDGRPVGSGKPGPVFERLLAAYQQAKAAQCI